MSWRVAGLFFALGVVTRLPFQTDNLWAHDSVLYAGAIERFAPLEQRPQPPGYLYYILLLRGVDAVTHDPNRAMTVVSLLAGAAAVALIYVLAGRLYDERTARASAVLLLTAVTFWAYGGIAYPYTLLAALSIGCAILFWRACDPEAARGPRLALASVAWGIAAGFRPDLGIFLAPLWLFAVWSTSLAWAVASAAVVGALVAAWFVASAALDGGVGAFIEALGSQSRFVDERYSILGKGPVALLRNAYDLARYLGRGLYVIAPLAAAVALSTWARRLELSARRRAAFLLLWTLAPLAVYLPIHIGDYGYVFTILPGLCIIAARGAVALAKALVRPRAFGWLVVGAACANAVIFLVSDTPLSATDVVRRDRGTGEKAAYVARPDLTGALVVTGYDAVIVEHYLGGSHPLLAYDPDAAPSFDRAIAQTNVVVWDDLIRVSGSGWEVVVMPHGARLRVARGVAHETLRVHDGLSLDLAR